MLLGLFSWLLAIMAVPLWAGLIGFSCLVFWIGCVHYERTILSFFGMIAVMAVAVMAFSFDPLTYVMAHPLYILAIVAGYAVVGLVWGYANWYMFMFKIKNALFGVPEDWKTAVNNGSVRKDMTFEEYASRTLREEHVLDGSESWPIKVREHIGTISMWMAYWPASLLQTLLWDLLQTLYTRLVVWMSTMFQKIASRHDGAIQAEAAKL